MADAATAISVKALLRDADGLPITTRTEPTLGATLGQWQFPSDPQNAVVKGAGSQIS